MGIPRKSFKDENPNIYRLKKKKEREKENKMMEEQVDLEYICLHRHIRNTPSDTEVHAGHQLRANRST